MSDVKAIVDVPKGKQLSRQLAFEVVAILKDSVRIRTKFRIGSLSLKRDAKMDIRYQELARTLPPNE